jgi:Leucine-rich repeat (LRR) protein
MKYHFLYIFLLFLNTIYGQKLVSLDKTDDIKRYKYPVEVSIRRQVIQLQIENLSSGRPLDLKDYKNLQIIRISDSDLGCLEIDFANHPNLQSFYISGSTYDTLIFKGDGFHFTEISLYGRHLYNYDFLQGFKQLHDVNIDDSFSIDMENLTENLLKINTLKEIYISNGQIKKIPASFSKFKHLDGLALTWQGNMFNYTQLFEVIKDIDITDLNLMFSSYKTLPPEIRLLKKVKHLYLRSSSLEVLPEEIGELSQLESLFCSETFLDSVPYSIFNLKNLKHLELMTWNFKSIPQILYQMTWLKVLDIGSIEWFPTDAELAVLRKKLKKTRVNKFN